ncbi:MAG TPA: hypothetical protein PKB06_09510, partial [Actinotalea sp.]|nr:hypothetical protein [Actinotalea sp.]
MSGRYVISRVPGLQAERAPVEAEGLSVLAALDRGFVVELDDDQRARLEAEGWRTKEVRDPHAIRLFGYEIGADGVATELPPALAQVAPEAESPNHLVRLVAPLQESWASALAERGVRLVEPIGSHAYFVQGEPEVVASLAALPFVEWTGQFLPGYKVNPELLADRPEQAPGLGPIEAVNIGVLAEAGVDAVAEQVAVLGGVVEWVAPESTDTYRSIVAQLPTEALGAIAARDDVRWIDAQHAPVLEDERSSQIVYEDLDAAPAPNTLPNTGY